MATGVQVDVACPADAGEHPSLQPVDRVHAGMGTHLYTNTPGAFILLSSFFLPSFPTTTARRSPFIYEITGRPFSKGTWLPWVTRCLSATGVILLTAAITGRG